MTKLTRAEAIVATQRERIKATLDSIRHIRSIDGRHGESRYHQAFRAIWNDYRGAFRYLLNVRGAA